MKADDQAIQTILLGLPEDIYAAIDSCETAQKIWLRVQQMMKGSDIRIQEKKAKLFNEWERFTSTDGKSIKSYYHRFSKLMNDFKRNKHFPKKISTKAFKLNYLTPSNNNQRVSSNPRNRQIAQPGMNMGQDRQMQMVGGSGFLECSLESRSSECWKSEWANCCSGIANQNLNENGNVVAARAEGNAIGNNEEARIQLQAEEFDLMATPADLYEIEEVNENCILMANLQRVSTSGTQTDKAPVYDSNGSTEISYRCYMSKIGVLYYDNEIFNMFTQEDQYTELLEPFAAPYQVQQNDSNVISEVSSVEQDGRTLDPHLETVEETRAYFESLYNNLAIEVEKEARLRIF
nr:hypothetical protein [Tanacetum cinerariifolium]